ncbi:hypothetical protein IG631_16029 [Alternaria alternata]|nr:hypothetical protein IG631_16029 [Alternaria alternata]
MIRALGLCLKLISRSKSRLHLRPRLHRPPNRLPETFSRQRTTHRPRRLINSPDSLTDCRRSAGPPPVYINPPPPPLSLLLPTRSMKSTLPTKSTLSIMVSCFNLKVFQAWSQQVSLKERLEGRLAVGYSSITPTLSLRLRKGYP